MSTFIDIAFLFIVLSFFIIGGFLIVCVDFCIYYVTNWSFLVWLDKKFYGSIK